MSATGSKDMKAGSGGDAAAGCEDEAPLVEGHAGVGGGRYFIYRPPLGGVDTVRSDMCGPDLIRSRSDLVVAGLVGSRRSGASRGDGERRSSMAATLLVLEDAGSPAAASSDRHPGGSTAAAADAHARTYGPV